MRKKKAGEPHGEPFACPNCGATVPPGAAACPECGSDEHTGWADDADKWEADIPAGYAEDDEFDYDEFVSREFRGKQRSILGLPRWLLVMLISALVVLLLGLYTVWWVA